MNNGNSKVIMITGASKGLGRELALAFAPMKDAKLALFARGQEGLQQIRIEAERLGAEVLTATGDMSFPRDVERFVTMTEDRFGRIDVLINNASILGPSPMPYLLDYPTYDFAEVLRVNAVGPFLMTKRVVPGMLQRGSGSIINVTSSAGNVGYAGWGAYGISKFALEGLTETWADELGDSGVRVNMVDPGEMNTEMHALAVPDCDYALNEPADMVPVFLYLASDASAHLNGQRLSAEQFNETGAIVHAGGELEI